MYFHKIKLASFIFFRVDSFIWITFMPAAYFIFVFANAFSFSLRNLIKLLGNLMEHMFV